MVLTLPLPLPLTPLSLSLSLSLSPPLSLSLSPPLPLSLSRSSAWLWGRNCTILHPTCSPPLPPSPPPAVLTGSSSIPSGPSLNETTIASCKCGRGDRPSWGSFKAVEVER